VCSGVSSASAVLVLIDFIILIVILIIGAVVIFLILHVHEMVGGLAGSQSVLACGSVPGFRRG